MPRFANIALGNWLGAGIAVAFALTVVAAPEASQHWAFQPVRLVELPAVKNARWVKTPVDRFILARLETDKLRPARPASREQLIRRVTFGLTGLPPTPEEIDAFVNDSTPDAFEKVVDRLLASPHYGERWARHWLDLARYAESDGFEHDAVRPHSWRYRDYVIQSFHADKPYDRFIREQVAGDELWPEDRDALIATAFNLLGPDMVDSADQVQRRVNTLNDMTDTTAAVFLGQTIGCARCHDHKFEAFTQRDYFSLQAFFAPAMFQHELPIPTPAERDAHEAAMAKYRAKADATQKKLDALEAPHRAKLHAEKLSKLSEDAQLAHQTPKEKRTMEQEGTVLETAPTLKISDAEVVKLLTSDEKKERSRLLDALKRIPKPAPMPMAMALKNTNGAPPKTFVLARGDYNNPREEVPAAFPVVLRGSRREEAQYERGILTSAASGEGRAALADWLTHPSNPLTARVMVNRIWQHHFGRGLAPTPGDFGTRGQAPTHPELLDWLAGQFVARGWSIKAMHKLVLLSATYQQSSEASAQALQRDSDNKLFSRQNRARLEGEAVRDSLLSISGRLNRAMGGPSVFPPIPADITKTSKNWTASADPADHTRRSIYIFARRNLRFPFLEAFDAPDSNLTCPERGRSTTAPQSLTLLNAEEVMDAASAAAARLLTETKTDNQRIHLAFRLILGKRASGKELSMARDFLQSCSSRREEALAQSAMGPSSVAVTHESQSVARDSLPLRRVDNPQSAIDQSLPMSAPPTDDWAELCRALFNLNSFVYVD